MVRNKKIIIYMPARNAAKTLERTVNAIPPGIADGIILVDNASTDGTGDIARRLGLTVFRHDTDRGYGGSQKTGYREALNMGADIVVMLHSDFQYDPTRVPDIVRPVAEG